MRISSLNSPTVLAVLFALLATWPTVHSKRPRTVMELIATHKDLSTTGFYLQQFPDVVLRLSDPNLVATIFLPGNAVSRQGNSSIAGALRGDFLINDQLNPMRGEEGAGPFRRADWQHLMMHFLHLPKALTTSQLKNGRYYTALEQCSTMSCRAQITLIKRGGKIMLWGDNMYEEVDTLAADTELQPEAVVVQGNLRAGKSIVHIIEGNLYASVAPQDDLTNVSEGFGPNLTAVAQCALKAGFDIDHPPSSSVVFIPTDAALSTYLQRRNTSLSALLSDPPQCASLLAKHQIVVWNRAPLYTPDMYAIAAAAQSINTPGAQYSQIPNTFLTAGKATSITLEVSYPNNTLSASPVTLVVRSEGREPLRVEMEGLYDWGGNTVSSNAVYGEDGSYTYTPGPEHVAHEVRVVLDPLTPSAASQDEQEHEQRDSIARGMPMWQLGAHTVHGA
eukprot:CAMPEP_0202911400 /NCGR_PEP_ID=MMETSP1392-20130828/54897_1 /ASSEMBLY_ACC=CAM_ASM_000868 /TAXON_ID=225041 /ORGANISM="Chlamydomonas chlamydogama, Strain SAG 11-48b" /LENGTH=447 /DNA_ID=CAMNT_0049601887 /DNA_START=22 /DNA_END=1366 /DNA_ORIENTATION=+